MENTYFLAHIELKTLSHTPDLTALSPEFANLSILCTLKVSFIFQVHYTWQKCRHLAQASQLTVSNPQN